MYNNTKEWKFNNGIIVEEEDYDYDLHCFCVSRIKKDEVIILGYIYPANVEDMESCKKALDEGDDPITGGWEDGLGNTCYETGWGKYEQAEEDNEE